jgi:mannose-6-phosphate isomerase-like protein (cupin superfamily)
MHHRTHDNATAALHRLLAVRHNLFSAAAPLTATRAERRWLKIDADMSYDAWLIAWGAESELAAHDHGNSHAVVHVLRGSLIEWYRDPSDRATWNVRQVFAGRSIAVPAARVHEVHNPNPLPALSLHVYSPPLKVMNPYDSVTQIGTARGVRA